MGSPGLRSSKSETEMKTFITRAPDHPSSSYAHRWNRRSVEMLTDNLPRPEKLENETKMKTFITRAPDHPRSSYAHRWNRRSVEMLTDNLPRPEKLKKSLKDCQNRLFI